MTRVELDLEREQEQVEGIAGPYTPWEVRLNVIERTGWNTLSLGLGPGSGSGLDLGVGVSGRLQGGRSWMTIRLRYGFEIAFEVYGKLGVEEELMRGLRLLISYMQSDRTINRHCYISARSSHQDLAFRDEVDEDKLCGPVSHPRSSRLFPSGVSLTHRLNRAAGRYSQGATLFLQLTHFGLAPSHLIWPTKTRESSLRSDHCQEGCYSVEWNGPLGPSLTLRLRQNEQDAPYLLEGLSLGDMDRRLWSVSRS
jgi:hypothetical protein